MTPKARQIGERFRARRRELGISQEDVAQLMHFKHRQTVSAIECGKRRLSPDELVTATHVLQAPLDYFTDPFRLTDGEARWTFRPSSEPTAEDFGL